MRKIERQRKVSAHAEVSRNFLQMHYAPFHRAWFIKFSAKTELRQIRMSREREGREMKREREMGKRGGKKERKERERERERGGGKGRVMYTFCALFATMFPENGGGGSSEETNSGMETAEIHIKTIQ